MSTTPTTGIWFIGARGGVATTVCIGLSALRRGLCESIGLVTTSPRFDALKLPAWENLVVGGHEIRGGSLYDSAVDLLRQIPTIDAARLEACRDDLDAIDARIRPGTLINCGKAIEGMADGPSTERTATSPREAIGQLQADLRRFQEETGADRVIVVNLASTEPASEAALAASNWDELEPTLDDPDRCQLPASSLYAIAALDLGMPYINFTPSPGSTPPAIGDLAVKRGTCHAGRDGKTGETLLKSALAPMFAARNLEVLSWVGHNIFGNMDGRVLDDPANKSTKISSKARSLGQILGYEPQTHVSIEYIASLGDWKTAWDHIHFHGFLGTPMIMQFTWQGCDSILAAPLVIDLVRLVDLADRRGETGELGFLASFFKSPLGTEEHDFFRQFRVLEEWVDRAAADA
jgi:myo-inositol-1-phosphate synthase